MAARADGFTLIETIMVLTIVGLMLTLVAGTLGSGGASTRTRAAANELAAALNAARGYALVRQTSAAVDINVESLRYSGPEDANGQFDSGMRLTLTTAQRERTGPESGRIRFFPDGSSTGGRIVIEMGQWRRLVSVDWLSGRVMTDMAPATDQLEDIPADDPQNGA